MRRALLRLRTFFFFFVVMIFDGGSAAAANFLWRSTKARCRLLQDLIFFAKIVFLLHEVIKLGERLIFVIRSFVSFEKNSEKVSRAINTVKYVTSRLPVAPEIGSSCNFVALVV